MLSVLQRLRAAKSELHDAEVTAIRLRKEISELESSLTMFIGGTETPLTEREEGAAAPSSLRPAPPSLPNQPLDGASPLTVCIVGANKAVQPARARVPEDLSDDGGEAVSGTNTQNLPPSVKRTEAISTRKSTGNVEDVDSDDEALCGQVGDGNHLLNKDDAISVAAMKNAIMEFTALSAAVNHLQAGSNRAGKEVDAEEMDVACSGGRAVGVLGVRAMRKGLNGTGGVSDVPDEYDEDRPTDEVELVRQLR